MGPKAFEKKFKKRLNGLFNETKVFFFHDKDKSKVAYINGNKLRYIDIFRSDYELDYWCNYFLEYLETGVFDDNSYWKVYDHSKGGEQQYLSDTIPVKMKCEKQIWSAHSPQLNTLMRDVRSEDGKSGVGFERQPKPVSV